MTRLSSADAEAAVRSRYSGAARRTEAALCCPTSHDPSLLKAIPDEVIERDYGCGDPSRFLRAGEVVLDLGSGSGKVCFIASQIVGPQGLVIGVVMNDDMLALARRHAPEVARRIGHANVSFRKGRIQDVALFRVLHRGGRAVISDIVADEDVPEHLQRNPEHWSGGVSGALREDAFLQAFEEAGFYGITVLARAREPWRTVEGIEFRSVTVAAYKGKEGPCMDRKQAVVYRGPFREVVDDDGHVLRRGVRTAVCAKTFGIFSREPYREHLDLVEPHVAVPDEEAPPFPCTKGALVRSPRETKGQDFALTMDAPGTVCATDGGCC